MKKCDKCGKPFLEPLFLSHRCMSMNHTKIPNEEIENTEELLPSRDGSIDDDGSMKPASSKTETILLLILVFILFGPSILTGLVMFGAAYRDEATGFSGLLPAILIGIAIPVIVGFLIGVLIAKKKNVSNTKKNMEKSGGIDTISTNKK